MSKNSAILVSLFVVLILFSAKKVYGEEMTDDFTKWDYLFKKYGRTYGIPWRWVKAICMIESNLGRAKSVAHGLLYPNDIEKSKSSDGKSWGLMQTTIPTSRDFESNVTASDLNDPETSVRIACKYLKSLVNRFGLKDRESIIRAYNGGAGFMSTNLGRTLTPVYYAKFKVALEKIMALQGGNEMEI